MTDRPILFSASMIRALLDGRKSMTRRMAWKEDGAIDVKYGRELAAEGWRIEPRDSTHSYAWKPTIWQRIKPGDRLWTRETWRPVHSGDPSRGAKYRTDVESDQTLWKSGRFMPRWASRFTLVVTATKIERLQDISEEDAIAEGFKRRKLVIDGEELDGYFGACDDAADSTALLAFENLWISLHGTEVWASNPEVVCLRFSVHRSNIDAMAKEAA